MKKSKFMLRSLCAVMVFVCIIPFASDAFKAKAASQSLTYEQYLAEYYLNSFPYDYYLNRFKLPYRSAVEDKDDSLAYQTLINAWQIGTFQLGDVLNVADRKYRFNETILFDILYRDASTLDVSSKTNKAIKLSQASTIKSFVKALSEGGEEDFDAMCSMPISDLDDEQYDMLMSFLKKCENTKNVVGIVSDIGKYVGYAVTVENLINKFVQADVIRNIVTDETETVLLRIKSTTDDKNLIAAIDEIIEICDEQVSEEMLYTIFTGNATIKTLVNEVLKGAWNEIASALGSVGFAISAGQSMGKSMSNIFFSTEKDIELYYQMSTLYDFEDQLKSAVKYYASRYNSSKTTANAKTFNASVDLLMKTYLLGMDYAEQYLDILYVEGFVNTAGNFLFNFREENYSKYKASLTSIKQCIEQEISFYNTNIYNLYIDEIGEQYTNEYGEDVDDYIELTKETNNYSEEEIATTMATLQSLSFETNNVTISEDLTLTEDMHTYGSLYLTGGTLNLNGYTLTVDGDFQQTGGTINIHSGTLNVGGDAIFAKIDSNGDYTNQSGYLYMTYEDDTINIDGDLIIYSGTSGTTYSTFRASNGVINVGGNLTNGYKPLPTGEGLQVNMLGTNVLTINAVASINVPTLNIANASSRNITIQGTITATTLSGGNMTITAVKEPVLSFATTTGTLNINGDATLTVATQAGGDIAVNGNLTNKGILLNGYKLTSKDMLVSSGTTVIGAGGVITVNGNFQQTNGTLNVHEGTLNINGNAVFARIDSIGDYTNTVSGTKLSMTYEDDVVNIGGDLITYFLSSPGLNASNGVLNISGNWTDYNTVSTSGEFQVNMLGSNALTINTSESIKVPTLNIANASSRSITMQGTITATTLSGGNMTITAVKEPVLSFATTTGTLNINGDATLTIATQVGGDIAVNGNLTNKGILLNGYKLTSKDMLVSGGTTVIGAGGVITVNDNFQQINGTLNVHEGTLNINGNAVFARIDSIGDYTNTVSGTKLSMTYEDDVVNIGGDLITYFNNSYGLNASNGVLNISGNWTDYNTVSTSGEFQVNMLGSNALTINTSASINVPTLNIANASSRSITMRGTISATTLKGGNMTITASKTPVLSFATTTGTLNINGDVSLAVATKAGGDITVNGKLSNKGIALNGKKLTVNGNMYIISGIMDVAGGTVKVTGELCVGNITSTDYTSASSYLKMVNENDKVIVDGDFIMYSSHSHSSYLTAGVLDIGGNFYQYSSYSYNFEAKGTHKVILRGENPTASFASESSTFNILEINKPIQYYTFSRDNCWNSLIKNYNYVTGVSISPTSLVLGINKTYKLEAAITPENADYPEIIWSSSDDAIAQVDENGVVTANYSGNAVITATTFDGGIVDTCDISVVIPEDELPSLTADLPSPQFSNTAITLMATGGAKYKFYAKCNDEWFVIQDSSENNICVWTPQTKGNYTVYCDMLNSRDAVLATKSLDYVINQEITFTTDKASPQITTRPIVLSATGGSLYKFYYKFGDTWVRLQNTSANSTYEWRPKEVGTYKLYVDFMDENGELIGCKTMDYEITDEGLTDTSGICGDYLSWKLDKETETLTIYGDGDMYDYSWNKDIPWYSNKEYVDSINFEGNITHIGNNSFRECELGLIAIPNSVVSIGYSAFEECDRLGSVWFEADSSLVSIGYYAFYNCGSLSSITLPETVVDIGDYAFASSNIKEISIPKSVESIGYEVFSYCHNLKSIDVDADNKYYASNNGNLYSKDLKTLIRCPANNDNVEILNTVVKIDRAAFNCCEYLIDITIPNSVVLIDQEAFRACRNLENITIPSSVTFIGNGAFFACNSLISVTIPDSVKSIDDAFGGCSGLTDIYVNNPECEIEDDKYSIPEQTIIHGYSGSTAEEYATKYDREFVSIDVFEANLPSGQEIGTEIMLTATGGSKYKFYYNLGDSWVRIQDTSETNTCTWIPTKAGTYKLYVDIMNSAGEIVACKTMDYEIKASVEFTATMKVAYASPQKAGTTIKLTVNAAGGQGELKYKFYSECNGVWTKLWDYSENNTYNWHATTVGTHTVYCDVMDESGAIVCTLFKYEIVEGEDFVADLNANRVSGQLTGTEIRLMADSSNGTGEVQYKFYIEKDGVWTRLRDYDTQDYFLWTPTEAGFYNIYVDAKDADGNIASKRLNFTVEEGQALSVVSLTANPSSANVGEKVTLTGITSGGSGTVTYKFYYEVNGTWVRIQDFSENNTCTFTPSKAGTYHVYMDAIDDKKNTKCQMITYVVG